ncbi:hypothetical protein QBC46DRAFT_405989 [Diplogelasinospora grovesii]|uniref:Uncharacterized protein n=1 Tax=Diplogelasinospora grovesii TaxID=303347 RepID=A0AAN6S759_9PEZI|nr:hypothetical protein QBC46DRAFT_405989 [Diplogelasinospora grovesii]
MLKWRVRGKAVNTSSPSAGSDISLDSTPPLYSPHVRQRMNKTVYDSAVLPLVERASASKHNFSELSAASSRNIRAIKLAKGDSSKEVTETAIFREHSSLIKTTGTFTEEWENIRYSAAMPLAVHRHRPSALEAASLATYPDRVPLVGIRAVFELEGDSTPRSTFEERRQ